MHEYMTRHMVALKPMTYAQMELAPGDQFRATPVDGDYFCRCGRAKDAQGAPASTSVAVGATETLPEPMRNGSSEPATADAAAPSTATGPADPQPRRRGRPSNASRMLQLGGGVEATGTDVA